MASFRPPNDFNTRNDIGLVKDARALDRVDFDFESPRMAQALKNLGLVPKDLQKK